MGIFSFQFLNLICIIYVSLFQCTLYIQNLLEIMELGHSRLHPNSLNVSLLTSLASVHHILVPQA